MSTRHTISNLNLEGLATEPLISSAILEVLGGVRAGPSHSFHHLLDVALRANEKAQETNLTPTETRQLTLISLFHDFYRSSQAVSDEKGFAKSVSALKKFCKRKGVSENSQRIMVEALTNPNTTHPSAKRISNILEYSDFVEFLNKDRILSFVYENQILRTIPFEKIKSIYLDKFRKKYSQLSPQTKKMVEEYTLNETGGRTKNPLELGQEAFSMRYPNFTDIEFLMSRGNAPFSKIEARQIEKYLKQKDYHALDWCVTAFNKGINKSIARQSPSTLYRLEKIREQITHYRNSVDPYYSQYRAKGQMIVKKGADGQWRGFHQVKLGQRHSWPPLGSRFSLKIK